MRLYVLGKAIISTACTGTKEILGDNEYGIIIPCGDSEKLAKAIENLIIDNTKIIYYERRAVERVGVFDKMNIMKSIYELL